jgi:hypothetical protein
MMTDEEKQAREDKLVEQWLELLDEFTKLRLPLEHRRDIALMMEHDIGEWAAIEVEDMAAWKAARLRARARRPTLVAGKDTDTPD